MKKIIAILVSALMLAAVAVGCSTTTDTTAASGSSSDGITLTFSWWGNQVRNERTQKVLDMYSESNPGISFDAQFLSWDDYWAKLATSAAGHTLPDIIQMDYSYLSQYVSSGLLVDLTPYIESGVIDVSNVSQSILDAGTVDGKVYAICNGINAPCLLYNKTLTDEAGITIKDNMTMEEYFDVCREVYEKTGYKSTLANTHDNYIEYYCRAFDQVVYGEDGIGATEDTLTKFYSLYEQAKAEGWMLDPAVIAESGEDVETARMVYGTAPDNMCWSTMDFSNQLSAYQNAAPEGVDIALSTWPSPDASKSNYLKPSQFFAITTDSANPEEAAKVIDYITNSVECNNVLLGERGIPVSSVVAEAIGESLTDIDREVIAYVNDVVTPNCSAINPPVPDAANECYNLNKQLIEKIAYGEITAAEAAQEMIEKGNAYILEG